MCCRVDINRIRTAILRYRRPLLLMAKANCYGLGLRVARAVEPQVFGFGVAFGIEGKRLRRYTAKPILVTTPCYQLQDLMQYNLIPLVGSVDEARRLAAVNAPLTVHIKLNTGLNRFGVDSLNELRTLLDVLHSNPYLKIEGVATHYANRLAYCTQNALAKPLLSYIYAREGALLWHSQATSTAMCADGMLRVGMGAYRGSVALLSRLVAVRYVQRGTCVGYDGCYVAPADGYIGVAVGGYADGIAKCMVGWRIRCRGCMHPIAAVCMDVTLIWLTCPCRVGDEVCYLDENSVDPPQGLYEMYTNIGTRFAFRYVDDAMSPS